MMNVKTLGILFVGLLISTTAYATPYTEIGDAGDTLGTAQTVPAGTTSIDGILGVAADVDLYELTITENATVTFYGEEIGSSIDSNLILFNAAGNGLFGDDDGGAGLDSQIVWPLTPGTYYIAYGDNNIEGRNAANTIFCGNDSGDCSANTTDTLDNFSSTGTDTGGYRITISGLAAAPIPTLSQWALIFLVGLLGLIGLRMGHFKRN